MPNPDSKAKFFFSDLVVVDSHYIGCVVKSWWNDKTGYSYEVYVRSKNRIETFAEGKLQRYVVSKELSEDEHDWHE